METVARKRSVSCSALPGRATQGCVVGQKGERERGVCVCVCVLMLPPCAMWVRVLWCGDVGVHWCYLHGPAAQTHGACALSYWSMSIIVLVYVNHLNHCLPTKNRGICESEPQVSFVTTSFYKIQMY